MKTLLLTLLAMAASAAPLEDGSEVEIVQPRRVSTSAAAGYVPRRRPLRIDLGDLLRSFGLRGGFGGRPGRFPMLVPRLPASNCDSGRFRLTEDQFDVVTACQRQQEQSLRQCILDGVQDSPADLRDFLGREEYSIAGVSVKYSISLVDDELQSSRDVTFRMCPRDEVNAVEGETEAADEADDGETAIYGPRPTFQFPDLFSQESPFDFDFENVFRPFFQGGSGGTFPSFPDFGVDTDEEDENCVQETFSLPRDAFKRAKKCRYGDEPFKQCLRTSLEAVEEAKELMQFVDDDDHRIVDTGFYQSIAAINGQVTRKYTVSLERCQKESTDGEQGDTSEEEAGDAAKETTEMEAAAPQPEQPGIEPDQASEDTVLEP